MATIEYFYAAYSGYAYIGAKLLRDIVARTGATLDHRPFDLKAAVAAKGGPHNGRNPAHRAYFSGREIQRWAEYREQSILVRPTHHDNDFTHANRVLIAAKNAGETTKLDALADKFDEDPAAALGVAYV